MTVPLEAIREGQQATPERGKLWKPAFLEALSLIPNVRHACEAAGISRSEVYRERQRDEIFALAWADAMDHALDIMERVAHQRATAGQQMKKVVTRTLADGSQEITETTESAISDSLLMFMLKRWRPEFRESFKITGPSGGPVEHRVTVVDETVEAFFEELDRLALPSPE